MILSLLTIRVGSVQFILSTGTYKVVRRLKFPQFNLFAVVFRKFSKSGIPFFYRILLFVTPPNSLKFKKTNKEKCLHIL